MNFHIIAKNFLLHMHFKREIVIFPGGVGKNGNLRRGGRGIVCGPFLENPEGRGGVI